MFLWPSLNTQLLFKNVKGYECLNFKHITQIPSRTHLCRKLPDSDFTFGTNLNGMVFHFFHQSHLRASCSLGFVLGPGYSNDVKQTPLSLYWNLPCSEWRQIWNKWLYKCLLDGTCVMKEKLQGVWTWSNVGSQERPP